MDKNTLIPNSQTFVPQWELDIHQELLMHHGLMVKLKIKTEILELISDFFYMTLQKTGPLKFICMLMHIIHNHFLK